jgi:plastocyanin
MARRHLAVVAAFLALGLVAPASLAQATVAHLSVEVVTRSDDTFSPSRPVIASGSTVTFRNGDGGIHNVNWDDNAVPPTPPLPDPNWPKTPSRTFAAPGVYRFYCGEHGAPGGFGMSGQVVVTVDGKLPPPPMLTTPKVTVKSGIATLRATSRGAGVATVVLKRRVAGRFVAAGKVSKRLARAGAFTISLRRVSGAKPGPGAYLAELRLKDALGRLSVKRSARFTIQGT